MKLCVGSKIYDVQDTREHDIVVTRNGRVLMPETRTYEMVVSEFRRLAQEQAYASREAGARCAIEES